VYVVDSVAFMKANCMPAASTLLQLIEPCQCEACGATFNVPRRAATADLYEDEPEEEMLEELALPAPPEVDLAALDKAMAKRLSRLSHSK